MSNPEAALNNRTSRKLCWVTVPGDQWRKLSQQFSSYKSYFYEDIFQRKMFYLWTKKLSYLISRVLNIKKIWTKSTSKLWKDLLQKPFSDFIQISLHLFLLSLYYFKPRVSKLWPTGQIQPATCYCKWSLFGTQPQLFIYVLSMVVFIWQQQSWVAVRDHMALKA